MTPALIFVPLLVQVLLTIGLYIVLARRKDAALAAGEVNEARRGIYDDAWPLPVVLVNNCIRNQFELPVLFYVLVLALWSVGAAGFLAVTLASLFALSRLIHARVQTGSNYVPTRKKVFMFGVAMVIGLAILLAIALIAAVF